MNRTELIEYLQSIFCRVLGNDAITLNENTTAEDIAEWTSLTHVQLINEIESAMNVHFSVREMMGWQNVGEIMDSIEAKQ
jgi:acyl carrier protein